MVNILSWCVNIDTCTLIIEVNVFSVDLLSKTYTLLRNITKTLYYHNIFNVSYQQRRTVPINQINPMFLQTIAKLGGQLQHPSWSLAKVFAPSTALLGSAQPGDAKPTQHQERKDFVSSIPKTKRPALLQTAAILLLRGGFAMRMVQGWFCSAAGCNTGAFKDGLCFKHGAKKICTFNDCTTAAQSRGLCGRHGGGSTKVCDIESCKTRSQARGHCTRHGAQGWCNVDAMNVAFTPSSFVKS